MSDSEYSVMKSDVIKSFDCNREQSNGEQEDRAAGNTKRKKCNGEQEDRTEKGNKRKHRVKGNKKTEQKQGIKGNIE